MRFAQRVVVITGGAKGIGAGCSKVFAQEGGLVAILDRDLDAARATAQRLGDQHLAVRCDVACEKQIAAGIAEVVERFGQIDCLINNAGIHPPDTPLLAA